MDRTVWQSVPIACSDRKLGQRTTAAAHTRWVQHYFSRSPGGGDRLSHPVFESRPPRMSPDHVNFRVRSVNRAEVAKQKK